MTECLDINIKTFGYGESQFYQTVLILKVSEATGMDCCNVLPTPTNVEAHLGTDGNVPEAKRYWINSYSYIIGMMLYMA